jgi:hypothetical protein
VRAELAVVYTAMAKHPSSTVAPSLRLNALTIAALIAVDRKLIDSRDFAECMPVFQALGGEVKDRIALLSATATATAAQASTGADSDATPVSKAGKLKRSRIEITEPNLNKSRKTASNPSAGAGNTEGEAETGMGEIVLDPETLTWSALLGPQGAHYPKASHFFFSLYFFTLLFFFNLRPLFLLPCSHLHHNTDPCHLHAFILIYSHPHPHPFFSFPFLHSHRLFFASASHTVHGGSA